MNRKKNWPTDHHIVPSSLGGSDHEENLMRGVRHKTHDGMHRWGMNREILLTTRMALETDIGKEICIDPDVLEEYFQISTMSRWPRLYVPEAFVSVADACGASKALESAKFQKTHWMEEQVLLRNTLDALRNNDYYPGETSAFRTNYLEFFREKSARKATVKLLEKKHGSKLLWVNSLQRVTRTALENALHGGEPCKTNTARESLLKILGEQEKKVESFIAERTKEIEKVRERLCPKEETPGR